MHRTTIIPSLISALVLASPVAAQAAPAWTAPTSLAPAPGAGLTVVPAQAFVSSSGRSLVVSSDGKYAFDCAAHPATMNGWFTVGEVAPTKFAASVGPKRSISLKPKVTQVGPATIAVNDRSRADNFHLTGPGVNRKTGVAFRGRVTWNVTLQPGAYSYRSDKHKTMRGSLIVTLPS